MANKSKIILIGSGGHSEACIDVLEVEKRFKILGLVDTKKNNVLNKYKVIDKLTNLKKLRNKSRYALIAIGQIKSPALRIKIYQKLKKLNFNLPIIISPKAIISKFSRIEEGTIIMHGAYVGPNTQIGKNCIINTNAHIEHGCIIEDNCHISTSSVLNGNVKIGSGTFVGSGSIFKEDIKVPKNSFIKMGSIIKN